jgi:hypothetical protein
MPTVSPAPLSGRYLSFVEREEIAIPRAQNCGVRDVIFVYVYALDGHDDNVVSTGLGLTRC